MEYGKSAGTYCAMVKAEVSPPQSAYHLIITCPDHSIDLGDPWIFQRLCAYMPSSLFMQWRRRHCNSPADHVHLHVG